MLVLRRTVFSCVCVCVCNFLFNRESLPSGRTVHAGDEGLIRTLLFLESRPAFETAAHTLEPLVAQPNNAVVNKNTSAAAFTLPLQKFWNAELNPFDSNLFSPLRFSATRVGLHHIGV